MSSAPADLLGFRAGVQSRTGLAATAVGIVGDGAHARTGGYHEGLDVLTSIGRYHPPATSHVGSSVEDYSARKLRDRTGLTNSASAVDIGSAWRQGHAAWLRFNVLLVDALHAGDPALAAVRAINYTVDGATKHRTDREHGWAVEDSTDTVLTHTHVEFYRDTEGRRGACLARLLELMDTAITGGSVPTQTDAYAANGDANAWAAVQMIDPYTVPFPGDNPAGSPVKVANPLAQTLVKIAADVAAIRAESGTVGLTDAQVAAIGAQVATAVGADVAALVAAVGALQTDVAKLVAAARAAGSAVG